MESNMPSTTPTPEDQVDIGSWIHTGHFNYQVLSFLGQGTYGKVVECTRIPDGERVAIKMIRNEEPYIAAIRNEVGALSKLKSLDPDKCNLVRWHRVFTYKGYQCLEFEHLDKSLFDLMRERNFQPLPLNEIRPIIQQLAVALHHLRTVGMIHADLKLENVMLVNHAREPFRVKLIDFGLACKAAFAKQGAYIQTRPFRSPEILLGLPFTEAADMWSLGCLAASLYLGALLYPGNSEYDMMRYIIETQGQPPEHLLSAGCKTGHFFVKDHNNGSGLWKLKTPGQYYQETGIQSMETRKWRFTHLDNLMHIQNYAHMHPPDRMGQTSDLLRFVDLLLGMLELDPAKRFTPRQVLEQDFITMAQIRMAYPVSSYVKHSFRLMDICRRNVTSANAVSGSSQQPPTTTTQPIQENPPPPPAERSSPSQSHCIDPNPSTSTQTTSTVGSGVKRKVDDEDGTVNQTAHLAKKHRQSYGSLSTSSSSLDSASCSQASTSERSRPDQPHHNRRKMADDEEEEHHRTKPDRYQRSGDDRKRIEESRAGPSTASCSRDSASYRQASTSERSRADQSLHHRTNTSLYKSSQTQRCIGSGSRREDERHEDRKRIEESRAGPSMASCSRDSASYRQASTSERSRPDQSLHHRTNTSPYKSSQTQRCIGSGSRGEHEDVRREDRKRVQESRAGPSTASCSRDSASYKQASTSERSRLGQSHHHRANTSTYKSSQTQRCIGSGSRREDERREDRKRVQESRAGPSTASCRRDSASYRQASTFERSRPDQSLHHRANASPCKSSQTQRCIESGSRREDERREDRKRVQQSSAAPSTASCSRDSASYSQASTSERSRLDQSLHHRANISPYKSSQTQRCIGSGSRREDERHEDRKRVQESRAGPSTSSSTTSSRAESHVSPRAKRKTTDGEHSDSDHDERSGQERKRQRKSSADNSPSYPRSPRST